MAHPATYGQTLEPHLLCTRHAHTRTHAHKCAIRSNRKYKSEFVRSNVCSPINARTQLVVQTQTLAAQCICTNGNVLTHTRKHTVLAMMANTIRSLTSTAGRPHVWLIDQQDAKRSESCCTARPQNRTVYDDDSTTSPSVWTFNSM